MKNETAQDQPIMQEEQSNQNTDLAIRADAGDRDIATPQIFGGGSAALNFWTSIPDTGDTRQRAAQVSQLMGPANFSLKQFKDKTIEVVNILAHNVTVITDQDVPDGSGGMTKNEVPVEATRIVFQLADGTTLDSVSGGVVSSLKNLFALAGLPPWLPPLKLCLKESDTRRGRRVYTLLIAE